MQLVKLGQLLCLLPLTAAFAAPTPSASPAPSSLDESIKAALLGMQPSLGTLSPWQKNIFNAEIIANGQDFVREHRLVGDRVKVDLDEALIRRSLTFYAPQLLGNDDPRAAVRVEAEAGCKLCEAAVAPLKKLLQSRLESRGIKPVWFKDEEMPATPGQGTPTSISQVIPRFGFLRALEISRGLQGTVFLRIETGATADEAHPEEGKYFLKLGMTLGSFIASKKVEFQPAEPVEVLARRLWTETMAEITDRPGRSDLNPVQMLAGPPEVLIRVQGVRDYFALVALKNQLQLAMGGLSPVLERSLSRGRAVLAIRTQATLDEVRSKLVAVTVGPQKLVLSSGSGWGKSNSALEGELK